MGVGAGVVGFLGSMSGASAEAAPGSAAHSLSQIEGSEEDEEELELEEDEPPLDGVGCGCAACCCPRLMSRESSFTSVA